MRQKKKEGLRERVSDSVLHSAVTGGRGGGVTLEAVDARV